MGRRMLEAWVCLDPVPIVVSFQHEVSVYFRKHSAALHPCRRQILVDLWNVVVKMIRQNHGRVRERQSQLILFHRQWRPSYAVGRQYPIYLSCGHHRLPAVCPLNLNLVAQLSAVLKRLEEDCSRGVSSAPGTSNYDAANRLSF
jgi:hypothetical protein